MEELLSLKWNNHKPTFINVLGNLRDKELYTDATLACEGKLYSVHKLVLSTCSDYFSDILQKIKCKNPVIVLKDIKPSDLEALLDYMYLGEVNVQQGDLASLIKAAECLRIKGLAESDGQSSPNNSKSVDRAMDRRDLSLTPPAKRKKRHHESSSQSSQYNGSESFTSYHSGTSNSNRTLTPTPSIQREVITSHASTETSQQIYSNVIPKLENHRSNVCSTITNLVDPRIKEEKDDRDQEDLECYSLDDDIMYKEEGEMNIVSSIDRGHNNIENSLPSLLQQVECEMMQSRSYQQASHTDSSVMQLDGDDECELSPYSFSVPRSAAAGGQLGEAGGDSYNQYVASDQVAGDGANAMSARCLICSKVFTGAKTKFRLERHMVTHTGQRPYQCLMCDYRAGLKEHLTRHIKSQHSLQK